MKKIFLIGHKSPDLDAVAAPVIYAHFLVKERRYGNAIIVPAKTGEVNKETVYAFNKANVDIPRDISEFDISEEDEFILIDHNEETQRSEIVSNEKIIEIVDHHKIHVNFNKPVRVTVMPLGATCTLIYDLIKSHRVKPSKKIQRLVLNAILSDTQGLKSSTTTGIDSEIAHELGSILEINLKKETFDLFKAKTDLEGLTPKELVIKDYKIYEFGSKNIFISQVETVEPETILANKDGIVNAIKQVKHEKAVEQAYVVVTDVIEVNSHIIYPEETEENILKKAFLCHPANNLVDIGAKMSRKKDIAPPIESVINAKIDTKQIN